jgi:hypothetical protein
MSVKAAVMPKHSKESLLKSESFADTRDLLEILLEDKKQYTVAETKEIIEKYNKKEVA